MRILFIGDIVGRPGRQLVRTGLAALVSRHAIDFVIANGENAAAGFGITREIGDELLDLGVDVVTSGNHIWDKKEALDYIGTEPRLLRPANYPAGVPGNGSYVGRARNDHSVGVINAMGRVFMLQIDDPFAVVLREIEALRIDRHDDVGVDAIIGDIDRRALRGLGPATVDRYHRPNEGTAKVQRRHRQQCCQQPSNPFARFAFSPPPSHSASPFRLALSGSPA